MHKLCALKANIMAFQQLDLAAHPVQEITFVGSMPERWQDGHIFSLETMPNGGHLAAAACSDGAVRLWRIGQGSKSLEPHAICQASSTGMGSSCSWSSDGNKLACSATDGSLVMLVGICLFTQCHSRSCE